MVTGSTRGAPVHPTAWAGIVVATVAGVLGLYGSMYAEKQIAGSPLLEARGASGGAPRPESLPARKLAEGEKAVFGDSLDGALVRETQRSKVANYTLQIVAFVLPFVLGLGAALLGGSAMSAVERAGGTYAGNALAVFAMLIGGLAAVTAACMMVSLYVWPRVPSLYTT
ncbi:hypothetical protein R5W24_005603 [Gemmata sp. JC717]|uniref:hypothetical protein n=1 Tax=Gemmata algarum TaxID=2975278 RepID=UPI0021BB58C2|nr:hypothetical protein [Gemmata algarum]MDY3556437.1 hypothetical protein [Gemmata algarum]